MEKWKRKLPLPRTKFHSETSMSFFTDPNEHELSLTVTFSHGQKCLHNYHKLWHCLLHLITTPRPFHEIFSLTLRSMNSSWLWDYLAVKIPLTLKKLKITTNYDFSCGTSLPWLPPPLSTRFSHRPWQAWTLLDSEIFSWQKYLHNYHKLWLCLLCLITLTHPPLHEIFSLTLRSMNSPWRWDYLVVKIPSTLKNLISPLLFS